MAEGKPKRNMAGRMRAPRTPPGPPRGYKPVKGAPSGVYVGSIVLDTQGRGTVVNTRFGVIALTLDHDGVRQFTVAQARKVAIELWQAAEVLEVAEGEQPTPGR